LGIVIAKIVLPRISMETKGPGTPWEISPKEIGLGLPHTAVTYGIAVRDVRTVTGCGDEILRASSAASNDLESSDNEMAYGLQRSEVILAKTGK
jgi:hypothetical protein